MSKLYRNSQLTDEQQAHIIAGLDINQESEWSEVLDFIEEQEGLFECAEDDILDTFTNGAYTMGANQMLEASINPNELMTWLEDLRRENAEIAPYSNIGLLEVVSITESYNTAREEA